MLVFITRQTKHFWLIAAIMALLTLESARAEIIPINQLPMYGGQVKNEAMKNADAALIESIAKQGLSREDGARQAVRSAWSFWGKREIPAAISRLFIT
jgi:hypothetical protein